MRWSATVLAILFVAASWRAGGQSVLNGDTRSGSIPLYRVSFERRDPVSGVSASAAIKLPFQCTSDGTFFVSFISTIPAGAGLPPPPPGLPPLRLVSVSVTGKGQTFDLAHALGLYVSRELDHYAAESQLVFLVEGAEEYKPEKRTYLVSGKQGTTVRNTAEQHGYIISFGRDGTYQRTVKVEDPFRIQQLAVFPSGKFLAYGYDEKDDSPKLAMLKEDGTVLKPLRFSKGEVPESLAGTDEHHPKSVRPWQLVPEGQSILILQGDSNFPLLEVNEGGAMRAVHPKLPKDMHIKALIPSDRGLYAVVGSASDDPAADGTIYEISQGDGALLRQVALNDGHSALDVTCIHDQKFLSLDYSEDKIIPLVGSAEPSGAADKQNQTGR